MTHRLARFAVATMAVALAACNGDDDTGRCNPVNQTGCEAGLYCEPVERLGSACVAPVLVRGTVADPTAVTTTMLVGARVVALDANRAPASTVGVSVAGGAYELKVRAARDRTGRPLPASITLRADMQEYQPFPGGIRPALPIDLSTAALVGGSFVVSSPLTALELLPLPGAGARTAWIAGTIARPPSGASPLVVAEPAPGGAGPGTGVTGIADRDGSYAIFNLTPGVSYVVKPYVRGANYVPVTTGLLVEGANSVPISASPTLTPVTVSGDLIFNNGANKDTDVSLVVESTYVETLDKGDSPAGLTMRAGASGGYSFAGVPDGKYVVLAAFGIDGDVRGQLETGNSQAPRVTVAGGSVVAEQFKIVPSVDLQAIGGAAVGTTPVTVVATDAPVFAWSKGSVDASAQTYRVLVFDAAGVTVWSQDVAAVTDNSVVYAGAALEPGMPYQLRILAISETMPVPAGFEQLSQTEDLLGVFTYRP